MNDTASGGLHESTPVNINGRLLIEDEIILRKKFAKEMVKCGNDSIVALQNCGWTWHVAVKHHNTLANEPYTKWLIKQELEDLRLQGGSLDDAYREEIIRLYRSVMHSNSADDKTKLTAAANLAAMQGLAKPTESKVTMEMNGGIMRTPVYVGEDGNVIDIDSFSQIAQRQQAELRQKVLESVVTEEE